MRIAFPAERRTELFALLLFALMLVGASIVVGRQRTLPVPGASVEAALRDAPPPTPPPAVEPLEVAKISPEAAKEVNSAVPFVPGPIPAARPFNLPATGLEREKAAACLTAAVLYEAGDDTVGQQAVAQVVVNRVRHPAYPKSVCGVVFQGSERATGCQFTFTCDGSLGRAYSAAAWERARLVAQRALSGFVLKRVGTATHYHTNWVVAYWASSLDKLTELHTHLFYRWRGWWGTPAAFRGGYGGPERLDRRIAFLVPGAAMETAVEGEPDAASPAPVSLDIDPAVLGKNKLRLVDPQRVEYVLLLDPKAFPGSYAGTSLSICKGKERCSVLGWLKADKAPTKAPITPAMRQSLSFLYQRNRLGERETIRWNCRQFARPDPAQCLPGTGAAPPEQAKAATVATAGTP